MTAPGVQAAAEQVVPQVPDDAILMKKSFVSNEAYKRCCVELRSDFANSRLKGKDWPSATPFSYTMRDDDDMTMKGTAWACYISANHGGPGGPRLFARLDDLKWCGVELTTRNLQTLKADVDQAVNKHENT